MTRIAVIEKEECINGRGCDFICGNLCPVNRTGKECIIMGEDNKPIISEELCIGCGICVHKCPTLCIDILNLPEKLDRAPIHRYGVNGFALYSLPTPIFGKVVGVLGKNGMGKSTAIKILAGIEKPNFGKETESSYDDLIEYFKGTESQTYFEKVKKGEITISYKPQQVDLIPKQFVGTVKELLTKVDEENRIEEISKLLDLTNILDNNVKTISGGELQRVAIAATVLKKANLYVFDEPSSFLDIKQRIKISKFIQSLADENTAVLVIEHDLIILDYMTDLVHIMYGKEGTFGIVANPRTSRVAINTYLDGYLREENMRIRPVPIRFDPRPPLTEKEKPRLVSWNQIQKKLGKFKLSSTDGEIQKHDVIGILGENGIGKTSFVKILAGIEKPDKGSIDSSVKVSYKPQYIETESEELVASFLSNAIEKYNNQIVIPLSIEPLFKKQLKQLSGGELQKVAIAYSLSQDADLFLMDEPSAYLDVEQRLLVSRIIRDFIFTKGKSIMIVDHDLLFLDNLSDKLMVFDGEPAVKGVAKGPFSMNEGMNAFLTDLNVTLRRDHESNMPRINKPNSQIDRKQRSEGKLFYSG